MPWKQFSPLFIWLECRLVLHPPDRYRQSAEWTMEWTIKFTPSHLSSTWSSRPCTPTYGLPIKVPTFSSSSLRNSTGMKLKFCEWYLNVEVALSKKQKLLSVSFSFCNSLCHSALNLNLNILHWAFPFGIRDPSGADAEYSDPALHRILSFWTRPGRKLYISIHCSPLGKVCM